MVRIRVLRTDEAGFEKEFSTIISRREEVKGSVEKKVRAILRAVREQGDRALFRFMRRYDRIILDSRTVAVAPEEIEDAYYTLSNDQLNALLSAARRIEKFHKNQLKHFVVREREREEVATELMRPLRRVGLYIPGGKAAYPSSVLMSAIPARVAAVDEVVMVSPNASSPVLAAARIAGVNNIYRIGGAQAIAALTYGTESIPRVDKIVGPGNRYVETAKRLVYGEVGLDMVAGPSEILIIADKSGKPAFIAADLLAQAEHDEEACCMLITLDSSFPGKVKAEVLRQLKTLPRREIAAHSINRRCVMMVAHDIKEAVELAERIAPEHLELMVSSPEKVLPMISCAGAVFLGNYSPVTVGDYLAGPSHILPTAGTARFFSPLGVDDFMRRMSVISYSREALRCVSSEVKLLALMEGLDGHAQAVMKREH
jgi:histidinol dehydrogenase